MLRDTLTGRVLQVGKVAGKFKAHPLVDGSPEVFIIAVDLQTVEAGVQRVYFTCNEEVYNTLWEGVEIERSLRRVVEAKCTSASTVPDEWNKAHPDVHFVRELKNVMTIPG
jgi:hypothetical protein